MNRDAIMTETDLKTYFQQAGLEHGYEDVDARYSPFKEFKVQWQRRDRVAEFQVSDYLRSADPPIVRDFAYSLMDRVGGKHRRDPYPPGLREWLSSDEFVLRNQLVYVQRSRNLARTGVGEVYDLDLLYDGLVDKGLVQRDPLARLSWTKRANSRRVGYCSALMRVIAVSSALDDADVPEFVAEYVLYHELIHLANGLDPDIPRHGPEFRRKERLYPRWREAETCLRRVASRRV